MQRSIPGTVNSAAVNHDEVNAAEINALKRPHWLRIAIGRALLWFIEPARGGGVSRADLDRLLQERDEALTRRIPTIMIDKNRRRGLGGDFV